MFREGRSGRYADLNRCLSQGMGNGKKGEMETFMALCNSLYRDVLSDTDFIATTPVAASRQFSQLFKPDIIVFDEAPHARELSVMIAIANFNPKAWILTGDHRQTRPFLATEDARDNKWRGQLQVSTMERAVLCGAVSNQLLRNHRAFGGLEALASSLFYSRKMVAADGNDEVSASVGHLRRVYLNPMMQPGQTVGIPRVIVHIDRATASRNGASWFNHDHLEFIMEQVQDLVRDPEFKRAPTGQTERGTIPHHLAL